MEDLRTPLLVPIKKKTGVQITDTAPISAIAPWIEDAVIAVMREVIFKSTEMVIINDYIRSILFRYCGPLQRDLPERLTQLFDATAEITQQSGKLLGMAVIIISKFPIIEKDPFETLSKIFKSLGRMLSKAIYIKNNLLGRYLVETYGRIKDPTLEIVLIAETLANRLENVQVMLFSFKPSFYGKMECLRQEVNRTSLRDEKTGEIIEHPELQYLSLEDKEKIVSHLCQIVALSAPNSMIPTKTFNLNLKFKYPTFDYMKILVDELIDPIAKPQQNQLRLQLIIAALTELNNLLLAVSEEVQERKTLFMYLYKIVKVIKTEYLPLCNNINYKNEERKVKFSIIYIFNNMITIANEAVSFLIGIPASCVTAGDAIHLATHPAPIPLLRPIEANLLDEDTTTLTANETVTIDATNIEAFINQDAPAEIEPENSDSSNQAPEATAKHPKLRFRFICNIFVLINEINKAIKHNKEKITLLANDYTIRLVNVLKEKFHFIYAWNEHTEAFYPDKIKVVTLFLNKGLFLRNNQPLLTPISRPQRYRSCTAFQLSKLRGLYIVSTSKYGLLISSDCIKYKVGGQIICRVNIL
jgi:ribosomal protein S8